MIFSLLWVLLLRIELKYRQKPYTCGFLGGTVVKNLPANAGGTKDTNIIPEPRRCPRGRNSTHSIILAWKIPWTMDWAWWATVHWVVRGQTRLGTNSWSWVCWKYIKLMLLDCGVGEDSWESLGRQWDPTSQS